MWGVLLKVDGEMTGGKVEGGMMPFADKEKAREYFRQYDAKRSESRKAGAENDKYAKTGRALYYSGREEHLMTHLSGVKLPEGDRKRPFLGFCEICGGNIVGGKKKAYHHWDDELPAMGIWVCYLCHKTVEGVDDGKVENYLELKRDVEKAYALKCLEKIGMGGLLNGV